jgi:aspartate beta-hydroxylase
MSQGETRTPAPNPNNEMVLRLVQSSNEARKGGRLSESDQLLARAAQLSPAHPVVLNELGLRMLQRGESAQARGLFQRATQADPGHPALWSNLAESLHAQNLLAEALEAVERALALDPRYLSALLQKAAVLEAGGEQRKASRWYRNALAALPSEAEPPDNVRERIAHARAVVAGDEAELAHAIELSVESVRAKFGRAQSRRADRCLDFLSGRRTRFDPHPSFMYFPEIPALEFFEREDFPWLADLESATEDIRRELMDVLAGDRNGLEPYIDHPAGAPLNQWKELNKSQRWSAYFLWNQAVPQLPHLARCPRTTEVLRALPKCDVSRRAPTAYFSLLDAHTRIPPHTGVTNTRAIVHLPLIIPPNCGFRVGNEKREWTSGKAWVFDDTVEHEAWNDSDIPRAILIFDVWNPFLNTAEREVVRAATEAFGRYYDGA